MRAKFLSALDVELSGSKWKLLSPFRYYSRILDLEIEVPAGTKTDFASVPRVPIAYMATGNTSHRAAVIHDFLYNGGICNRRKADAVFFEAMKIEGQPIWRRWTMWSAVRLAGWSAWRGK